MPGPNAGSDDSSRMRELFDAMADLDADERRARLDALTVTDDMRRRLHAMFEADSSPRPLLSLTAADVVDRLRIDSDLVRGLIGRMIGSFRLLALIGEGGSSAVFRAERAAGSGAQTVALKLLRTGLFSADGQRRFRREQSILAQLTHPNIAHLVEGGISDAGIPYIAMEFVDGRPITHDADARALDLSDRLRLFVTLCRAVDAAHAALVVHRDLKPSNVLVTRQGEIKVLDFGIARLLDDDTGATHTQSIMLTPEYAAPEQYRAGPVTIAADVYALGVLLGELLTGRRLAGTSTRRASSYALDADAGTAPAGLASGKSLARQLRGDLDAIIANALAEDPARRYRSAGALADDIEAHLDRRPVRAHPPSRWYRTRKFVARHRGSVATTVAFLLAIFAALGIALWQANVARQEARRANTVKDFIESIFAPLSVGTAESKQPTYRELLASSIGKLDHDDQLGAAERVDLLLLFARLSEKIGEYDEAQALADRASAFAEQQLGSGHLLSAEALAESGSIALHHGRAGEAENRLRQAEQHYRRAGAGGMPLIRLYNSLSELADGRGDAQEALRYAQLGLTERLATFAPDDEKIAVGYNNLGFALESTGDFAGAIDAHRRAYAIHQRRIGTDAFETAIPLMSLGANEALSGHLRQGREDLLRARVVFAMATGKPRQHQVRAVRHLCAVEAAMSFADAPATCDEALRLSEAVFGKTNPNYAVALRLRGAQHVERGDLTAARSDLSASVDALAAGAPASWRGRSEITLGELEWLEGRSDEAIRILQSGLAHFGNGFPITSRFEALAFLALACSESTAVACNADAYRQASDAIANKDYAWSAVLLPAHTALARVELHDGKPDSAVQRLRQAIMQAQAEVESSSPRLADAQLWLAIALARSGDCASAHAAIDVARAVPGTTHADGHPLLKAARIALTTELACELSASH